MITKKDYDALVRRVQALEAMPPVLPPVRTRIASAAGSNWNWLEPVTIASGTDAQAEETIDLIDFGVPNGATEIKVYWKIQYDEDSGIEAEFCEMFTYPFGTDGQSFAFVLTDGSDDTGAGGEATLPIQGSGLAYSVTAEQLDGGSLTGEFTWTIELRGYR